MPLSLLNHSALALFAQRKRIPTSARSIGFCAIWVCISSSSSRWCLVRVDLSSSNLWAFFKALAAAAHPVEASLVFVLSRLFPSLMDVLPIVGRGRF